MRTVLVLLVFLAIPAFAAAQQADAVDAEPVVQLEQSTPAPTSGAAVTNVGATHAGADVEMETRDAPVEDAASMQEPGSRNWWWIVGAVVVGGLIVVLLT